MVKQVIWVKSVKNNIPGGLKNATLVAAAVLGRPRVDESLPPPAAPPPGPVRASPGPCPGPGARPLSTLLVAGRFCLAGLAGSGRLTQTDESLNNAAADLLLVNSAEVTAVGEKLTMGLAVSRCEQDAAKRLRTSCTVSKSAGWT